MEWICTENCPHTEWDKQHGANTSDLQNYIIRLIYVIIMLHLPAYLTNNGLTANNPINPSRVSVFIFQVCYYIIIYIIH